MNYYILGALYNSNVWLSTSTLAVLLQKCRSAFYFRKKLSALHYKYISTVHRRNLLQQSVIAHKHCCTYVWIQNTLRYMYRNNELKCNCDRKYHEDCSYEFGYISQSKYNVFVHFLNSLNYTPPCISRYIVKKDDIAHTHDGNGYHKCDWCRKHSEKDWGMFHSTKGCDIFYPYARDEIAKVPSKKIINYQSQFYNLTDHLE